MNDGAPLTFLIVWAVKSTLKKPSLQVGWGKGLKVSPKRVVVMGSAYERGRSEEPVGVVGRRVGFQVCLLSSAPAALATDRLEGRGRGHHRMQCQEGSSSRGGAVQRSVAAPGFPTAAGSRAQELPEVSELERTCARSPCLGESQGRQGHQCQGRCQAACLLRPLTRSENP